MPCTKKKERIGKKKKYSSRAKRRDKIPWNVIRKEKAGNYYGSDIVHFPTMQLRALFSASFQILSQAIRNPVTGVCIRFELFARFVLLAVAHFERAGKTNFWTQKRRSGDTELRITHSGQNGSNRLLKIGRIASTTILSLFIFKFSLTDNGYGTFFFF